MAAFPRDQDFLEDASLLIAQQEGGGSGLISTFPDFSHLRGSQYDIIGVPDSEGIELLPAGAAASGTDYNINILANYTALTPLLERPFQSNVHGGCYPGHLGSSAVAATVATRKESPELPSPTALACNRHPAALSLSVSPNPTVVGLEDESNPNLRPQLPGHDCVPRESKADIDPQQCRIRDDGGTNLKQPPPSSPEPGADQLIAAAPKECNKRKRNQILSGAPSQDHKKSRPSLEEDQTRTKRLSSCSSSKCQKKDNTSNAESRSKNAGVKPKAEPPTDYIHVRARRGQATDSHSLAERVRREKISERMRKLQDLVPGCNKVTGKAVMLDEIINYIQSLQNQVEFLSMKLASLNPRFSHLGLLDGFLEELLPLQGSGSSTDPSAVYEAEGHHQPLMQHQMPCALDMAFPTSIAAYNSLTDRPRLAPVDGRAVGFLQCGCNTIR